MTAMTRDDEHTGQGGRYQIDPKTGERTLIEAPTAPETPEPAPHPARQQKIPAAKAARNEEEL